MKNHVRVKFVPNSMSAFYVTFTQNTFFITKLYLYDRPTRICFDLLRVVLHVKIYKGKNQFVARIWCKTMFVFILYNSLTNPEYKKSILKILGGLKSKIFWQWISTTNCIDTQINKKAFFLNSYFSLNRPLGQFSQSRDVRVQWYLCVCVKFISRPLIGPQVTWPDPRPLIGREKIYS